MYILQYIFISSVCLSIFYAAYRLMFRNETNFRQLRFYLLASILISVILPLTNISINVDFIKNLFLPEATNIAKSLKEIDTLANPNEIDIPIKAKVDWFSLIKNIYFIFTIALLTRIGAQIISVIIRGYKSKRIKLGNYVIISNNRYKNAFSFFHWIFINTESSPNEDIDQILSHEKVHASQYHSIDLIVIELLAAVMWFNPLVWMMRNSIQLVHEFLADEGALSTGIDRLRYQALLLNQVAEERLICLSSNFNHSLIKKRMIMMTKSKFNQKSKLKILALLPVTAISFILIAGINGLLSNSAQASPKPTNKTLQTDRFDIARDTVKSVKVTKVSNENSKFIVKSSNKKDGSKITYIVDGVEVDNIDKINMDSIKSVNVLKKDMIIEIKTKSDPKKYTIVTKDSKDDIPSNIVYIIDGVECSSQTGLDITNPDSIEKVDVIKDKNLMKKYTNKECDGVILISSKKKSK